MKTNSTNEVVEAENRYKKQNVSKNTKSRINILLKAIATLVFIFGACNKELTENGDTEKKGTVTLALPDWDCGVVGIHAGNPKNADKNGYIWAGEVKVSYDAVGNMTVVFTMYDGWVMTQAHLYVGELKLDGKGEPIPPPTTFPRKYKDQSTNLIKNDGGHFDNLNNVTSKTITIEKTDLGDANCFVIAAHASVGTMKNGKVTGVTTGFGWGNPYSENPWAMCFKSCVYECGGTTCTKKYDELIQVWEKFQKARCWDVDPAYELTYEEILAFCLDDADLLDMITQIMNDSDCPCDCPEGFECDDKGNCVYITSDYCPDGYMWNGEECVFCEDGKCPCEEGFMWNDDGTECVPVQCEGLDCCEKLINEVNEIHRVLWIKWIGINPCEEVIVEGFKAFMEDQIKTLADCDDYAEYFSKLIDYNENFASYVRSIEPCATE